MLQMTQRVPDTNHDMLQNFISDSKWSAQEVMDRVALQVNGQIGHPEHAALIIDESGFTKKGAKSVGVARQWLGSIGKVDNGQVGVFAALCNGSDACLVNARLYLPQEWTSDVERCKKAGVPEHFQNFLTKDQIALQMVKHARELGLNYGWVGADAGYGKGLGFMQALDELGETFMVDVHSDFRMFLKNPKPVVPSKSEHARGRTPIRSVVELPAHRVDTWIKSQPQSAWKKVPVRDATKGTLYYEVFTKQVWLWEKDTPNCYQWHLVVRRNTQSKTDIKYSLCNAPKGTDIVTLAKMQAQRYWIERTFEDAKGQCGMADYEVRGWDGWHHHMALVLMAQSFMLDERLLNREEAPLLSCADIVELLYASLPQKNLSIQELARQMEERHRKRQSAIDSAHRNQLTQ